ncbi:hypothetical protein BASA60_004900 [Batrachochytrium salamandrivorans]|nr:hypothetical protein BASA60_004900 [Batrachochytrium salamandrivorans]
MISIVSITGISQSSSLSPYESGGCIVYRIKGGANLLATPFCIQNGIACNLMPLRIAPIPHAVVTSDIPGTWKSFINELQVVAGVDGAITYSSQAAHQRSLHEASHAGVDSLSAPISDPPGLDRGCCHRPSRH